MPALNKEPRKKVAANDKKDAANLFSSPGKEVNRLLDAFPQILEKVWPLNAARRRELPADIKRLSTMLTSRRGELRKPYWSDPANVSAYLYYFLPWNLVRLTRLLRNLPITSPETCHKVPFLIDTGAGPLTLPISMWLARPRWRSLPVHVFALDICRQPLELGRSIFKNLGEMSGQPVWPVGVGFGPAQTMATHVKLTPKNGFAWVVAASNMLNEIQQKKSGHGSTARNENQESSRLSDLLEAWLPVLDEGSQLLFVEPGTRLGGTTIMRLRDCALELGMTPVSPCVHSNACPFLEGNMKYGSHASLPSSWCHFSFSAPDAPAWLVELSDKAGLGKRSLTLSPLLLKCGEEEPERGFPLRIISRPFAAAEMKNARYACSPAGLALIESDSPSGSLLYAQKPSKIRRDAKSGAIILDIVASHEKQPFKKGA